jgi:hypothetical protein
MPRLRNFRKTLDAEIGAKNLLALQQTVRGRWYDLMQHPMPDPILVIGCSRLGTTITHETIGAARGLRKFGCSADVFMFAWNRR